MITMQLLDADLKKRQDDHDSLMPLYSRYDNVPFEEFKARGLSLNEGCELKSKIIKVETALEWLSNLIKFLKEKKIKKNISEQDLEDWTEQDEFGFYKKFLIRNNYLMEKKI